jgi:hypothetical protein
LKRLADAGISWPLMTIRVSIQNATLLDVAHHYGEAAMADTAITYWNPLLTWAPILSAALDILCFECEEDAFAAVDGDRSIHVEQRRYKAGDAESRALKA